jgi:hypothetical protein
VCCADVSEQYPHKNTAVDDTDLQIDARRSSENCERNRGANRACREGVKRVRMYDYNWRNQVSTTGKYTSRHSMDIQQRKPTTNTTIKEKKHRTNERNSQQHASATLETSGTDHIPMCYGITKTLYQLVPIIYNNNESELFISLCMNHTERKRQQTVC